MIDILAAIATSMCAAGGSMVAKKTMTLNLTDAEMRVLDELCEKKDLSKTAVMRQALRLYQLIEGRVEKGDKLFFEDESTKEKAEVMML
ncbi:ribbon-helix-helix protein, CopG family [Sphingomonas sp. UV9]|jgi:predicted transcriptional regulator|uniref:ribbon-helix-helix protein, CopG family n=1 Tax=Sphingomonas sp. UV9 TaxID=1851410 RepID=UPI001F0C2AC0|nr:ribbon-helix-helix protein, CopG family [Sphingomonas sp. UV9]